MKNTTIKVRFFVISMLLHMVLMSFFSMHMGMWKKDHRVGTPNIKVIQAYVFQYNSKFRKRGMISKKEHINNKRLRQNINSKIHLEKKSVANLFNSIPKQQAIANNSIQASPFENMEGDNNKLLKLLHNAIARAQNYSGDYTELGKKTNVIVQFVLHPDGRINKIKIIKSSGSYSLDQSVINSVEAINPFRTARKYIKLTTKLSVNIVFSN